MARIGLLFLALFYFSVYFPSEARADISVGDVDFSGYLRAGSGTNSHGGVQECFYNSGASSNEMRLGNECGVYAELGFGFWHLRPTPQDPGFFKSQFRFSFSPEAYRLYDRIPATNNPEFDRAFSNRGLNLTEIFTQGGKFHDFPLEAWIGKRFYRDADVHIMDWYYFGDMSGVGAGIMQNDGDRTWALAHLIQGSDVRADRGISTIQALDFRYHFNLIDQREFHIWSVYGWSPAGENQTNPAQKYIAGRGEILGFRYRQRFTNGFTDGAVIYGHGLMSTLNLYNANPAVSEAVNKGATLRLVGQDVRENLGDWALLSAVAWEKRDSGQDRDSASEWQSASVRPVYMISDHRQLAVELGHSRIRVDAERNANGSITGWRELTRITMAPQLSLRKGLWGRPVLRMFYTQSFWNTANRTFVAGSAPSFLEDNNGTSFGYQVEAWF
jgi:maltoporin